MKSSAYELSESQRQEKELQLFIWRMAACSELNKRLKKWLTLCSDVERIERLDLNNKKGAYQLLSNVEATVTEFMTYSTQSNISAFHKEEGMN